MKNKIKVSELINEVCKGFEGDFFPSEEHILAEYNNVVRALWLLIPESDVSVSMTASGGKLECDISPCCIRRVFCGEYELLKASRELIALMPEARLYCPCEDGIFVTVNGECTVFYRSMPNEVSLIEAENTKVPFGNEYLPLIKAWLMRSVHLYVGDFEGADAYGNEYNRLLEDFKRENGVKE